ncbi:MAG: arginyltransferase [Gammaproteobacteria bacterium]|nr:arginyltransferase [Gammaproteobacteria bacterium]
MNVDDLKFYLSTEQKCGYLNDRQSASVFADPEGEMSNEVYSVLINHGFRRSADFVYRPHCAACSSCKPARIPVEEFAANRNQKRVWKRNSDISISAAPAKYKESHFQLYQKYISHRHSGGEMDHTDKKRYIEFLSSDWCNTIFYELKIDETLVAVAVTDNLTEGLSALYTFFDPELTSRSLGTLAILWQIEKAKELDKPWVYLGYWIEESEKMSYKKNFSPLQIWENNIWQNLKK